MVNHERSWLLRRLAVTLAAGVSLGLAAGTPMLAHAAEKSLDHSEKVKVRADEENRLAKEDNSSAKQAKALAEQYRQTAKRVAKQGGDPAPLLQAAAHFDSQANAQSRVKP